MANGIHISDSDTADPLSCPILSLESGVGFYLFRLPFYELLQGSLVALALITLLAVLVFYAYFGSLRFGRSGQMDGRSARPLRICPLCSLSWSAVLDGGFT